MAPFRFKEERAPLPPMIWANPPYQRSESYGIGPAAVRAGH